MNLRITPEIQSALDLNPTGPIRLVGDSNTSPVFLVRLDDLAKLQKLVDSRLHKKLAEASMDIASQRVVDFDPETVKQEARDEY